MTDGIIQEVFSKIGKEYILPLTREDIDFLQQELIKKINKEIQFHCTHSLGVCRECHLLLKSLIGDNQE